MALGGFVIFYSDLNCLAGADEDDELFINFPPMFYQANDNQILFVFKCVQDAIVPDTEFIDALKLPGKWFRRYCANILDKPANLFENTLGNLLV